MSATLTSHNLTRSTGPVALNALPASSRQFKNGQVKAVSVGSFLGLGGKHVSVPFNALQLTEKNGKRYLVVDTTKEALRSAPGYRYDSATGKWLPKNTDTVKKRSKGGFCPE
jgi:PRC-barrel domain